LVDLANTGSSKEVIKFLAVGLGYLVITLLITYLFKSYHNTLVYRYMLAFKDSVYMSALSSRYNEGVDSGEYINALTNDSMQIEMMYVNSCLAAPQQFFAFLTGTCAAIVIHPLLFGLIFIFGVLSALFMKARSSVMMKTTKALSQDNAAYSKALKAHLDANLLLRMEHLTDWSRTFIFSVTDKALCSHRLQKQVMNTTMITVMSLGLLSTLIVMGTSSLLAIYGLVSVGSVIASGHLIGRITSPIGEMGRLYTQYKAGKALRNKIKNKFTLSDTAEKNDNALSYSTDIDIERITVSALNFWIAEKHILKNITMQFDDRKKYAIVGQAGSGKSTLLKLIAGIFDSHAQIEYNGKHLKQQEIFDNICYIPQNITILEETLKNNIILNEKNKACDDLIEKIGLHDLAEKRKINGNIIDSTVSGGEKQKIAMARALLKDRSVFLFDEFNSGLDNYSIKHIENMLMTQTDKLIIFITHRLNLETLKKCDEIIYMRDGEIIEHGSFQSLVTNEHSAFKHYYESDAHDHV